MSIFYILFLCNVFCNVTVLLNVWPDVLKPKQYGGFPNTFNLSNLRFCNLLLSTKHVSVSLWLNYENDPAEQFVREINFLLEVLIYWSFVVTSREKNKSCLPTHCTFSCGRRNALVRIKRDYKALIVEEVGSLYCYGLVKLTSKKL